MFYWVTCWECGCCLELPVETVHILLSYLLGMWMIYWVTCWECGCWWHRCPAVRPDCPCRRPAGSAGHATGSRQRRECLTSPWTLHNTLKAGLAGSSREPGCMGGCRDEEGCLVRSINTGEQRRDESQGTVKTSTGKSVQDWFQCSMKASTSKARQNKFECSIYSMKISTVTAS